MERDELAAWLRLTLAEGTGTGGARRLLAAFGLPQAIFSQPLASLEQIVGPQQAAGLLAEPQGLATLLDTTWAWLQGQDGSGLRRIVTLGDAGYPAPLLATEDPPFMLYMTGQELSTHALTHSVAVVGSRNPTPQGQGNAQQFAKALAGAGMTVVSGMALGVDGAAHQGALDGAATGQLATIAVVGTGLDRVYPKRHLDLAHAIARQGVIISEYPLGTPPLAANFPRRNRIIAGLATGTLVVEAALQSGSLITARLAVEQGKEVFAIPGSIHSPQSRGCHWLLKQGAKLVESAQDILEELKITGPVLTPGGPRTTTAPGATGPHASLLEVLGFDPVGLDALVARTGTDTAALQVQLLELELQGQVARLPGGLFQRRAST